MFFILRKNYELAFISHIDTENNKAVISFAQIVSFLNKGALMQTLQDIPNGSTVKISAKKCHTMSNEIQEVIADFRDISSKKNNIDLELIGFDKFLSVDETSSNKRFFLNATTILILNRYQNEIKSASNKDTLSIYNQMLKDIFFINNLFYDDYKSFEIFIIKGQFLLKHKPIEKEFSKFHRTVVDNAISNDELYQEWMSLKNDDEVRNIIASTNNQIIDFNNENKLEKDYFKFWEIIHKSVSNISDFSTKQYND